MRSSDQAYKPAAIKSGGALWQSTSVWHMNPNCPTKKTLSGLFNCSVAAALIMESCYCNAQEDDCQEKRKRNRGRDPDSRKADEGEMQCIRLQIHDYVGNQRAKLRCKLAESPGCLDYFHFAASDSHAPLPLFQDTYIYS